MHVHFLHCIDGRLSGPAHLATWFLYILSLPERDGLNLVGALTLWSPNELECSSAILPNLPICYCSKRMQVIRHLIRRLTDVRRRRAYQAKG